MHERIHYLSACCRVLFTSPLHRTYFMVEHYNSPACSFAPSSIESLIIRMIERFDPEVLRLSLSRSTSTLRLYERAWQMEAYRSLLSFLSSDCGLSPDAGQVSLSYHELALVAGDF